jgi:hypothetical protein
MLLIEGDRETTSADLQDRGLNGLSDLGVMKEEKVSVRNCIHAKR